MPIPPLVKKAREAEDLIAKRCGSGTRKEREFLAQLLRTMVTGAFAEDEVGPLLAECPEVGPRLRRLAAMLTKSSGLPQALCTRYLYGQSEAKARYFWRVSKTEWRYVHELAERARGSLTLFYELDEGRHLISSQPWHDELEEEFGTLLVSIETKALEDLLLAVLEGYLSKRKGERRRYYEVYGLGLGMRYAQEHYRRGLGWRSTTRINIMRSQPQLMAESGPGSVEWNKKSLHALRLAAKSLFPAYELIGDWHSHPYDSLAQMDRRKGWEYSRDDEADLAGWLEFLQDELGQYPAVSLVVAVASCDRRPPSRHHHNIQSTLALSIAGCRVVINAYRILGNGRVSNKNVVLTGSGVIEP